MEKLKKLVEDNDFDSICKLLVSSNKRHPINDTLQLDRNLVHIACRKGNVKLINILASLPNFEVNSLSTTSKNVPLHFAIQEGHFDVFKILMKLGADPTIQDKDGYSPLHFACINRRIKVIKELYKIKDKIKIDCVDTYSRTALHRAAETDDASVVREILKFKPKLDIQDKNGQTPLHYSSFNNNRDICSLLCDAGASTGIEDKSGKKSLFWGFGYEHY